MNAATSSKRKFGNVLLKNVRYTAIEWDTDQKMKKSPLRMIEKKKLEIQQVFLKQKGNQVVK